MMNENKVIIYPFFFLIIFFHKRWKIRLIKNTCQNGFFFRLFDGFSIPYWAKGIMMIESNVFIHPFFFCKVFFHKRWKIHAKIDMLLGSGWFHVVLHRFGWFCMLHSIFASPSNSLLSFIKSFDGSLQREFIPSIF